MEVAMVKSFRRLFKYITGENEEGIVPVLRDMRSLVFDALMVTSLRCSYICFFVFFLHF